MARMTRGRVRIGMAVGADAVTAVARAGAATHEVEVPLAASSDEDGTDAIAITIGAVARALGEALGDAVRGARVRVALLPPHCDARLVPLPPLRPGEAAAVLRRDAGRHFPGASGPRVIAVAPARRHSVRDRSDARAPVLAAAATVATLEAVRDAVVAAGWRLDTIVAGYAAWFAVAGNAARTEAGQHLIVSVDGEAAHVFHFNGPIRELRRVPASWIEEIASAAGAGPGTVTIFADHARRERIARALIATGWSIDDASMRHESALTAAAAGVDRAGLELVPPTLAAERRGRDRTVAVRAAATALLLLAGVAALELWGTQRELDAVRAQRLAIRADVAPLLAARDSLTRLEQWTASVASLSAQAPRWSRALFDIAMLLPKDAHVTVLQTRGDTLRAEVVGTRAGEALQALRSATSLADIRLEGMVERDLQEGTTAREQFRFTARLIGPSDADNAQVGARSVARRSP